MNCSWRDVDRSKLLTTSMEAGAWDRLTSCDEANAGLWCLMGFDATEAVRPSLD